MLIVSLNFRMLWRFNAAAICGYTILKKVKNGGAGDFESKSVDQHLGGIHIYALYGIILFLFRLILSGFIIYFCS